MCLSTAAVAAPTAYMSDAAFSAANGATALTLQSFEVAPTVTATSLNFGNVAFNCTGSTYCPGFFGRSTVYATDGIFSVFFATPDSATFTFSSTITSFGVDVVGLGDVGVTNFFINNGSGPLALQSGYSAPGGTVTFAGLTDSAGFTTVTFTGTQRDDGIFFDRLRFGTALAGAVPETSTWAMMISGFGLVGGAMRRRRASAVFA
mgnify:CR=1 FL=1